MRKFSLNYLFGFVLVATIFFDDPHLYYFKRIIYIAFMLLSLWELYLFYFDRQAPETDLPMPSWYPVWAWLFLLFVGYNLIVDLRNPAFSLITQLNHPLAALMVIPVLAFRVGYQTAAIGPFVRFLLGTCLFFCFFFVVPIQGSNIYTQGLTCCYAVLPLAIFAIDGKKYRPFIVALVVLSILYSQVSESRTILLRIMLFFGLLIAMSAVKRWGLLKFLVMGVTAFFVYQVLTNLQSWLQLFKSFLHVRNFDDEDTRTFLYNELFADMNTRDLLLGRGFQGNFFSPYFLWQQARNHDFTGDFYYRFSVEVGFLECLLKGGFVFFLLYITPLVSACYRSIFSRHSNKVAFLIGIYILCELLILFVENIPSYHFQFFLIFFLAGYCCRQTALRQSPANENIRYNALLQPGPFY